MGDGGRPFYFFPAFAVVVDDVCLFGEKEGGEGG